MINRNFPIYRPIVIMIGVFVLIELLLAIRPKTEKVDPCKVPYQTVNFTALTKDGVNCDVKGWVQSRNKSDLIDCKEAKHSKILVEVVLQRECFKYTSDEILDVSAISAIRDSINRVIDSEFSSNLVYYFLSFSIDFGKQKRELGNNDGLEQINLQ